jgi:hypothetical protein
MFDLLDVLITNIMSMERFPVSKKQPKVARMI